MIKKDAADVDEYGEVVPVLQATWACRLPGLPADYNNYLQTAFYKYEPISAAHPAGRWLTLGNEEKMSRPETLLIKDLEEMKPIGYPRANAKYRRLSPDEEAGPLARKLPKPWEPNPVPTAEPLE